MKYDFDDFIGDSKAILDKVSRKTEDAVNVSKAYAQKFKIEGKLREKYYLLGRLCFDMHEDDTDKTGNMKILIKEIKMLKAELEYAEEAAGKPKMCRFCGAKNPTGNSFCANCGEKL